ncbi:hypothetical protein AVEN_169404-1 [Araneus ventricosus]|uniref:Uncharacterized protein n=1 Tax=Araneus ventricosus TaxID=182803 RepID=A0A4Y2JBR2_ARAVE|nr:hypothetical protein AVEN_169404-1 [Araneus ventricosus]
MQSSLPVGIENAEDKESHRHYQHWRQLRDRDHLPTEKFSNDSSSTDSQIKTVEGRRTKWLGYRPIDTSATEMYHPSNGSPRTANTWRYFAVHEKQEANRAASTSDGELPRLPSREGKTKSQKQKKGERVNWKGGQTVGYLGDVNPVTSEEDVPLRGSDTLEI